LGLSPALADTKEELEDAKAELAAAQAELDEAVAAWSEAQTRLGQTRNEMDVVQARIGDLQRRLDVVNARLQARAALAYTVGPASSIEALLSSSSFSDFSDRLEFLGSVTQSDVDLALERQVAEVELQRERQDLANLSERQRETVAELDAVRDEIDEKFGEIDAHVDELTAKYNEEQAAARRLELLRQASNDVNGTPTGPVPAPSGSGIQVCPVAGPVSFIDSFGDPRVGHTHQGIDLIYLISPAGTPVVAAHPGSVSQSSSTSGGLQAYVRASGGTYTFYAHLSSYGTSGSVSAGTVIGYVGSTGNAGNTNHLHFEYHPGGGAAINPYQMLLAVC
jgi:murein DD-endopeptidase MepM/ murein hydrolase activator NlpD